MGQGYYTERQMLEQEETALNHVRENLLSGYERRIDETDMSSAEETTLSGTVLKDAVDLFSKDFAKLSAEYKAILYPKKERKKRVKKTAVWEDPIAEYKAILYPQKERKKRVKKTAVWEDPIAELKNAYTEIESLYLYQSHQRGKCKQLFKQLLLTIDQANAPPPPEQLGILGRLNWKYIEKMLVVEDDTICALLPFLLTAYVYNFRKNRFISRGSTVVEGAFNQEKIETIKKSEMKKRLIRLSTYFGFRDYGVRFDKYRNGPLEFPSLRNEIILDLVFDTWCAIFSGYRDKKILALENVQPRIDFKLSYELYLYYKNTDLYKKYLDRGGLTQEEILSEAIERYNSRIHI